MVLMQGLASTITALECGLGISADLIAGAANVDVRTVERWRAGKAFPQRDARERIAQITALLTHLEQTFSSPEAVREWMHTDSRYLGFLKPAEVARTGRIDRIEAALHALDAGLVI